MMGGRGLLVTVKQEVVQVKLNRRRLYETDNSWMGKEAKSKTRGAGRDRM